VVPPDTQIATGPTQVVEMVNSTMSVFDRSSGSLVHAADLAVFYSVGGGTLANTDPRILYDAPTGRFFTSILVYDTQNLDSSEILVAVSTTSDAAGTWRIVNALGNSGLTGQGLLDQPNLGVNDTLVVVSANDFAGPGASQYAGGEVTVLQKSDLLGSGTVRVSDKGIHSEWFSMIPVNSTASSGGVEYLVMNNSDPGNGNASLTHPAVIIASVSGSPATNNVVLNKTAGAVTVGGSSAPPSALQQGGGATLDTGDTRLQTAVSAGGNLWMSGDTACTPAGDSTVRACARLIELSHSSGTWALAQDMVVAQNSAYLFYPAVAVSGSGDMVAVMTQSSASMFASVVVTGQHAGAAPNTLAGLTMLNAGIGSANFDCGMPCNTNGVVRWGDYSGAAMDPVDPNDVWVAGEFKPATLHNYDWGTALGRVTFAGPAIHDVTPNTGSTAGGASVTVNGTDFPVAGASVTVGGAATTPTSINPDQITLVAPPMAAGVVNIALTAPNGSTADLPASHYLYVATGPYRALTPARIVDTRPGGPGPLAGQTLGPQATLNVPVTGVGGVPPTGVSAVVFNITGILPTQGTYITGYPTGLARPTTSSLNLGAGQIVGNLVEIPVGAGGSISFFNAGGNVDVAIDVQGYVAGGATGALGLYNPLPPARLADTRAGSGQQLAGQTLTQGGVLAVQVDGTPTGVPASGVAAVALNLTVVGGTASSFITVYPSDVARPFTSSLNYVAGDVRGNRVIVPVSQSGTLGQISVFGYAGNVDIVIDVVGWYSDASGGTGAVYSGLSPARLCDTRPGFGSSCSGSTLGGGGPATETLNVQVAGRLGIPPMGGAHSPTAVVCNMTIVVPTAGTWLTAYPGPAGAPVPFTADLNSPAGDIRGNMVLIRLGPDGSINVANAAGASDIVLDVVGYYAP
jgi:hypothetical protein